MKRYLLLLTVLSVFASARAYTNPILPYDYSDPDVVQVAADLYMTYSTFACTPGLQILQSRDGVNWQIVDAALPDTIPGYGHLDACPAGCGVWAPSIRYYDGRFYIFYGDPDIGIFCVRSEKTKSLPCQWEPAVLVKRGKGLIDPCPLWDNDGRVYLVHAFAGSRAGIKSLLAVCELSADALSVIREDKIVFDGHVDNPTCEGPKFYKMDNWYYIFCPAGGVKTGWQLCLRSHSPYGPFEVKRVLEQGRTSVNGPHQGAWVLDKFYHFQDVGVAGRIVHLQPLRWQRAWPIIGEEGEPIVSTDRKKEKTEINYNHIPATEDFSAADLAPYWQWSGNRKAQYYCCHPDSGYLRLFTYPSADIQNAPNLLLRKIPSGTAFTIEVRVRFTPLEKNKENEQAGFIIHGRQSRTLPIPGDRQWRFVRVVVSDTYLCRLYLSRDGKVWELQGEPFQAVAGEWIGAKVGFYATRSVLENNSPSKRADNDSGYLDIDRFELITH